MEQSWLRQLSRVRPPLSLGWAYSKRPGPAGTWYYSEHAARSAGVVLRKMPSAQYRRPNTRQGKGAGNAQKTGTCHNCGKQGHWARECRAARVETNHHTTDWASTTVDFVRAGNIQGLDYLPDRWLVDSASTCLVANEFFPEFFNCGKRTLASGLGGAMTFRAIG